MPPNNLAPPQNFAKEIRTIKGLLPAFDNRDVTEPFVMQGRNFLVDTKGPFSAFANSLLDGNQFTDLSVQPQSFIINGNQFLFVKGACLQYDSVGMKYDPLFLFADSGDIWPWSSAFVGNKYFFCRKGVGVLEFDPIANQWSKITSFIPTDPRGCCAAVGRLVVVGSTVVAWSNQDDGSIFTPDLTTGAGFQGLSIVGGSGLCVKRAADGFYTFTSTGWFKSEYNFIFSQVAAPFRHYPLDGALSYRPINQWSICSIEDTQHVFLDSKGIFSLVDNKISPYLTGFSEFFFKTLKNLLDINNPQTFRLSYSDQDKVLYLSIGDSARPYLYLYAYAFYIPVQECGIFNYPHYGFLEFLVASGPKQGIHLGFLDSQGYLRFFQSDPYAELSPIEDQPNYASDIVYWAPRTSPAPYYDINGTLTGISVFSIKAYNLGLFANLAAGLYIFEQANGVGIAEPAIAATPYPDNAVLPFTLEDWNTIVGTDDYMLDAFVVEDWGTSTPPLQLYSLAEMGSIIPGSSLIYPFVYSHGKAPLLSYVRVGYFKPTSGQFDDELTTFTNMAVGNDPVTSTVTTDDYMDSTYTPDVLFDWNTNNGDPEDWGTFSAALSTYSFTIYATNDDGSTIFMQEDPMIAHDGGSTKYYASTNNGIAHFVDVKAMLANQSFHLNFLSYSAILSGRL